MARVELKILAGGTVIGTVTGTDVPTAGKEGGVEIREDLGRLRKKETRTAGALQDHREEIEKLMNVEDQYHDQEVDQREC